MDHSDLCMLPLVHLVAQMILLHIGKQASLRWYKICPSGSLLLGTMPMCALRLYWLHFQGRKKIPWKGCIQLLLKSAADPYRANIWSDHKQMENIAPASSDEPQELCKNFMYITRLHNFCINEGWVNIVNADDNFENLNLHWWSHAACTFMP